MINILYLVNKDHVQRKMSRVRFHSIAEIGKQSNIKLVISGKGWPDYDNSISVSENIDILANKTYNIDDTMVLSTTTLGNTVKNSSLETIGTIQRGEWNATPIDIRNYTDLDIDNDKLVWNNNILGIKDYYVRKTGSDTKKGNLKLVNEPDIDNDPVNTKCFANCFPLILLAILVFLDY